MHEHPHHFLQTMAIVLCTAACTTMLFQRLRQPVVLGYLLAGMIVGPYVPIPLEADSRVVQTLAELGVILLMFALGTEFSLQKLTRVGATAGFAAVVESSLMVWLGFLVGQAFGWSKLQCFYAGAICAISSTTIIVKAFEEHRVRDPSVPIVFGILIVEDLIAILLITILTTLSQGERLGMAELGFEAGRLIAFLGLVLVVGLLTVPRLLRSVVRLKRAETTVVAGVGLAFGLGYLFVYFGYSAALGAFLAGSLVAESGTENIVRRLVEPVRDIFAALFFVSVGMLIDPYDLQRNWSIVLAFLVLVVVGKVVAVSCAAFLTGQSVQTSIKTGMTLAQIGEFSFIIAALGVAAKATDGLPYSIAVAVSGITTLLTPWLIRVAQPTASWIDRKLPRRLQTFVALYGSWLEQLKSSSGGPRDARIRALIRWLIVDTFVAATVIISASIEIENIERWAQASLRVDRSVSRFAVIGAVFIVSVPFWIGMLRAARFLGYELADRTFPAAVRGVDLAAAPRRLLIVTLQLAILGLVGLPLAAITQPFLPPLSGSPILLVLFVVLVLSLWRGAANFQGHAKAAAQAIAEALTQMTRDGRGRENDALQEVNQLIAGLGSPVSATLADGSPAIGKTLAEINLRGLTGATVLAIHRSGEDVLVPSGHERLRRGDMLALAGTHAAVTAAQKVLDGDLER